MKYRGVELKVGNEFESEICIGIEYDNTKLTQDKVIKMIRKQISNVGDDFTIEPVLEDYILVRNYKFFALDNTPAQFIMNLQFALATMNELKDVKVVIDVHTDDWFEIDGEEYNTDYVDWDNFVKNLEK